MRVFLRWYTDKTESKCDMKVFTGTSIDECKRNLYSIFPDAVIYGESVLENGQDNVLTGSRMVTV